MNVDYDYVFRLIIIGDPRVGKSSLLHRFIDDSYTDYYQMIIVADFRIHTINLDGKVIKLQIWDASLYGRYRTSLKLFFRGICGVIIVYDVTDPDNFGNVEHWLQEIERCRIPNVCKLLVGNKCDMTSQKIVDYATAKEYADEMKINFIETSAKYATNVEQAFLTIVCDIKRKLIDNEQNCNISDITQDKRINLKPGSSISGKNNTSCCRCC